MHWIHLPCRNNSTYSIYKHVMAPWTSPWQPNRRLLPDLRLISYFWSTFFFKAHCGGKSPPWIILEKRSTWLTVCCSTRFAEGLETMVAIVDSHAATWSYHLIPTKSPRVPVNDGIAAGWNTNTPCARPNNRGGNGARLRPHMLPQLPRRNRQCLINCIVSLIHSQMIFGECEIVERLYGLSVLHYAVASQFGRESRSR